MTITTLDTMTETLKNDLAFQYSVEHKDTRNMQMVLRAYGFDYTYETARSLININL